MHGSASVMWVVSPCLCDLTEFRRCRHISHSSCCLPWRCAVPIWTAASDRYVIGLISQYVENHTVKGQFLQRRQRSPAGIKGRESTRPYGVYLEVLEDMASFYPKLLPAYCFPPFPIGWGTRKLQPSSISYYIFPCKMDFPHGLHGH